MLFEISDELVVSVNFGYQVTLMTDRESCLILEGPFTLMPDGLTVDPEEPIGDGARRFLGVLFSRMMSAELDESVLIVRFSNGMSISVPPIPGFEAWSLYLPGRGPAIIMGPNGNI